MTLNITCHNCIYTLHINVYIKLHIMKSVTALRLKGITRRKKIIEIDSRKTECGLWSYLEMGSLQMHLVKMRSY